MALTIVIPTRDKVEHLRLTLGCLRRQTYADVEVVVVDDGSTDATPELLATPELHTVPGPLAGRAAPGPRVRTLRLTGVGRAAARNAGASAAAGDILVFLDDDILVPPGFAGAHAAVHRTPAVAAPLGVGAPDGPVVVHGPLRELPGSARLLAAQPEDAYRAASERLFGRTVVNTLERMVADMASGAAPPVAPWLACVGANVSMPREAWRRAGGFDEAYGQIWGCEDLELGHRLHAAGARLHVVAQAGGIHLSHARPGRWDDHAVNLRRFLAQHPDPAVAALPELLSAGGSPARYLRALDVTPVTTPSGD